jgi:hypothetical protein
MSIRITHCHNLVDHTKVTLVTKKPDPQMHEILMQNVAGISSLYQEINDVDSRPSGPELQQMIKRLDNLLSLKRMCEEPFGAGDYFSKYIVSIPSFPFLNEQTTEICFHPRGAHGGYARPEDQAIWNRMAESF